MPIIHCDRLCIHNDNEDDYCKAKRKERIYWIAGRCSRFRRREDKQVPPPPADPPITSPIVHDEVKPGYKRRRWKEKRTKGIR